MALSFEEKQKNETMRVLGKQVSFWNFTPGGIGDMDFRNVMSAHNLKINNDVMMYLDFVMLGVIYGQKMERARKSGKEIQPIDITSKLRQEVLELFLELNEEEKLEVIEYAENMCANRK